MLHTQNKSYIHHDDAQSIDQIRSYDQDSYINLQPKIEQSISIDLHQSYFKKFPEFYRDIDKFSKFLLDETHHNKGSSFITIINDFISNELDIIITKIDQKEFISDEYVKQLTILKNIFIQCLATSIINNHSLKELKESEINKIVKEHYDKFILKNKNESNSDSKQIDTTNKDYQFYHQKTKNLISKSSQLFEQMISNQLAKEQNDKKYLIKFKNLKFYIQFH